MLIAGEFTGSKHSKQLLQAACHWPSLGVHWAAILHITNSFGYPRLLCHDNRHAQLNYVFTIPSAARIPETVIVQPPYWTVYPWLFCKEQARKWSNEVPLPFWDYVLGSVFLRFHVGENIHTVSNQTTSEIQHVSFSGDWKYTIL